MKTCVIPGSSAASMAATVHVSEAHLHRHAAEFDFTYNNRIALGTCDLEGPIALSKAQRGKRLTYRTAHRKVTT
jgi:hypothetical protein